MPKMTKPLNYILVVFCILIISSPLARALSILPTTLEQDVQDAYCIFNGTLVDSKVEDDVYESGSMVVYYTFKINECLKGDCEKGEFVFKQHLSLGRYKTGQTYLLFLAEPHEMTGLTAPLGITAGRYDVIEKDGKKVVPSLKHNQALKRLLLEKNYQKNLRLTNLSDNSGIEEYETFRAVIKDMVNQLDL